MHPWDERWNKYEENVALRVAKKHNLKIERKILRAMIDAIDNWRERQNPYHFDRFEAELLMAKVRSLEEEIAQERYPSAPAETPGFRQPPAEQGEVR